VKEQSVPGGLLENIRKSRNDFVRARLSSLADAVDGEFTSNQLDQWHDEAEQEWNAMHPILAEMLSSRRPQ
jgi:hypothetical protein